uniref:Maestro heat-like repeat-containing protein family member 7 n=1 Tax=Callorhinus ursinus TaxID=34884 RepID=A0A3Q7MVC0_CALUR|nr:maestro heat-like repeat-containing protein family member 7 [Callorhinus ursinus]
MKQKTEAILKDLQKHFRGGWFANIQSLTMVPEIIQYICHNMNSITETTAQGTIKKILYLLAQTYTDEVILTLFKMDDQSQRGVHKPWEILASFPKGYEVIMEFLLQKLAPHQKSKGQEPSHGMEISPLIATRAIHELLLEPSRRMEVQTFFSSLFMALLFRISFLVLEGDTDIQDQQHATEWVDPVSSSMEALKTLMLSTGYGDYVSYVQKLGAWELLTSPERHYEGVTLLARTMVIKNCWHNRPIFSLIIRMLQEQDYTNHLTALVFMTELLRCPGVAAIVDEAAVRILADWFHSEEPATVKLLLQVVGIFAKHRNMVRQLHILQPHLLHCCYSQDSAIVMEALAALRCLTEHLSWQHSSSFLTQLTFTLGPFFEEVKPFAGSFPFSGRPRELGRIIRKGPCSPNVRPSRKGLLPCVLSGSICKRREMCREQTAVTRQNGAAVRSRIPGGQECAWERALGAGSAGPSALQGGQRWRCLPCMSLSSCA